MSVYRVQRLNSIGFVWECDGIIPWTDNKADRWLANYGIEWRNAGSLRKAQHGEPQQGDSVRETARIETYDNRCNPLGRKECEDRSPDCYFGGYYNVVEKNCVGGGSGNNSIKFGYKWKQNFQLLLEYKNKHKHVKVPRHFPVLGDLVNTQRIAASNDLLSDCCMARSDSIGFVWIKFGTRFMRLFKGLLAFQLKNNGSTNVPFKFIDEEGCKLGDWVCLQRRLYREGTLSEDKIALLESIGFGWHMVDCCWMEMYHRLVAWEQKYGTTHVPQESRLDSKLGHWVPKQRMSCKQNRVDLLNEIGFIWSVQ